MKDEYDFSKAKRGALVQQKNKSRITIYIDTTILDVFRERADQEGRGYQTMLNDALREYLNKPSEQLTVEVLRKVLREELTREKHESLLNYPITSTTSDSSLDVFISENQVDNYGLNKLPSTGN